MMRYMAAGDDLLTLQDVLTHGAACYGGHPAVGMAGGPALSYAALCVHAQRVFARLSDLGVGTGDRVALLAENGPWWGVAYFAITTGGAVAVPLMTEFSRSQVSNLIEHADCRAIIVSRKLREKTRGVEADRAVLVIEELAEWCLAQEAAGGVEKAVPMLPPVRPEDLAAIIYTSGTTGVSKGVMLTHHAIVFDAGAALAIVHVDSTDRLLSVLPLAHAYECTLGLIAPLMKGASISYLDRLPSATTLLPAFQAVRPTIMLSVPLIIEKLYRNKVEPELVRRRLYARPLFRRIFNRLAGRKLKEVFGGHLAVFAVGGSALAPDVEKFLAEAGFPYAIGYGLTETAPVVAGAAPGKTRLRMIGPAVPGVEIRVTDVGAADGVGEIQVRGPNLMKGYYRDPERTREVFTEDGWFRTGDLGALDRSGRLSIRGRSKTMILGASGENIYPEEIEAVLNKSRQVDESVVFHDGTGLSALVRLKDEVLHASGVTLPDGIAGAERAIGALLEQIRDQVNEQLASFSRLRKLELQPVPFEKTPSQKIKRFLYPGR